MKPKVVTPLPGPNSQKLLQQREHYVTGAIYNIHPIFVAEAQGALVKDVDGNVFLDFCGGIGQLNFGHRPDEAVQALKEQADKFIHICWHVAMYDSYVDVARKLVTMTPGDFPKKVALFNSGAEAVENAVKFARQYTKRPGVISIEGAFHGRTLLGMSLSGKPKPNKLGFGPFAPETYKIPSPYCYRCAFKATYPGCDLLCATYLRHLLDTECAPENVAALIVEPVQGESGFIVPPKEYFGILKAICDQHGIVFVDDEIQAGLGRTGKVWAIEHWGIVPDMLLTAKSIAAGLPLSAVIGRQEIMEAPPVGGIGSTFGGSPVACAVAGRVLEKMGRENLPSRAADLGQKFRERLEDLKEKYPVIGEVRGLGCMMAIELVKDRQTKEPAKELAGRVVKESLQLGLLCLTAGPYGNVVRLLPPLVISEAELDLGLDLLDQALARVVASC